MLMDASCLITELCSELVANVVALERITHMLGLPSSLFSLVPGTR